MSAQWLRGIFLSVPNAIGARRLPKADVMATQFGELEVEVESWGVVIQRTKKGGVTLQRWGGACRASCNHFRGAAAVLTASERE